MVPSDWDSAPRCICGPNFISDLIGESPIFSAARFGNFVGRFFWREVFVLPILVILY